MLFNVDVFTRAQPPGREDFRRCAREVHISREDEHLFRSKMNTCFGRR